MAARKDYYAILEVDQLCADRDIKKAHPSACTPQTPLNAGLQPRRRHSRLSAFSHRLMKCLWDRM